MGKKILSSSVIISIVIILIAFLSFPVFASAPAEIEINGAIITLPSSSGEGWSYDSGVLTLNGFHGEKIRASDGDLVIIVNGSNSVTSSDSFSITTYNGDLTIKGDGVLDIINTKADNNISIVSYEKSLMIEEAVTINIHSVASTECLTGMRSGENMTISTSGNIVIDVEASTAGGQSTGIYCIGAFTHFGTGNLSIFSRSPTDSMGLMTNGGAKFAGTGSVSLTSDATASEGIVMNAGLYGENKDMYFTGSGDVAITATGATGYAVDCYNVGAISFESSGDVVLNAPAAAVHSYENTARIGLGSNNIVTDPAGAKLNDTASAFVNADGTIALAVKISYEEITSQPASSESTDGNSSSSISDTAVSGVETIGGDKKGFHPIEILQSVHYTWWIMMGLVLTVCIIIAVLLITKRKKP